MTNECANALFRYFETLYELNQNLIILCGVDVIDNKGQYEKRIDEIVMAIPRLVPYVYNKKTSKYKITDSDGLMKFSDEIPFLLSAYESILQQNNNLLGKIKKIRNKLEHEMHGARIVASSSGSTTLFSVTYGVEGKKVNLDASEIIAFAKEMNTIFTQIQGLAEQFACERKLDDHPYYWRLIRYRFSEFNKIYESQLLRTFGKALLPF
jgi:hypothetical protein